MHQRSRNITLNRWPWKMAWRDSRTHRKRLILFMSSIVLGIAALVSISSFGKNLEKAIDDQAKTLMGADLMLSSLQPFTPETEALIDSIGGDQAREIIFGSMAYFPKSGDTRLVQVRILQGEFPFYGKFGTQPIDAVETYKSGPNALVDDALMQQFKSELGDSIKIGAKTFSIAGKLKNIPSEPPIANIFSPRVYLPMDYLDQTKLIQRGSLVTYRVYFKFEEEIDVEALVKGMTPHLNKYRLRAATIENRKKQVGNIMDSLYRFLNLVGFVALILGSIGVASAVHVYTKQKFGNISILRCVGAKSKETFLIYLIQVAAMTLFGSIIGALAGIGIQLFLPNVFSDFLPVKIEYFMAWQAILEGIVIGLGISLLFTLLPLLSIRKISPLLALRSSYESALLGSKDKFRWFIYFLIVLAIGAFAISQIGNITFGLSFTAAIVVAFGVITGVAKLIIVLFKRYFPKSWTYVWRQGLANLYRPNNQTLVLMLSIGLGTFLITTLYLSRDTLLEKVTYVGGGNRPNLILFDVQPDQKDDIADIVRSFDLPIVQEAPIVTMRLASIKGRSVEEILSDSSRSINKGLLTWEFRTTYRDNLFDSEEVVAGTWQASIDEKAEVVPISFEQGAANRLDVMVGDTIVWNVQGVSLTTNIASLRKVDWQRLQANFFVVFPEGVLEYAPQIYVLATRVRSTEKSAQLQRAVLQSYPNVSMIDLALVLNTLDTFLSKISFVIRFMAFFSIFTGLIVLSAAVMTSRYQRIQESILLRTLGASRTQIIKIMMIEYVFLGGFAALTGLILSYAGSWALAYFVFDSVFIPTVLPFLIVLTLVIGLTILIGLINSQGILDRPPLEVLRVEV
ncbi:MAG: ABC transporter permease [bacterium]